MIENLLGKFPDGYNPNTQQTEILTKITEAFNEGYKFVVCCAPTGSGKSFIAKTLGNASTEVSDTFKSAIEDYSAYKRNHMGGYAFEDEALELPPAGTFALTITKSLQDQYNGLFSDIKVLKGKSNYQCQVDTDQTVEFGPCNHVDKMKEECWVVNKCPYYNARNVSLVSKLATLNYNMFFALPNHLKRKEYVVCDEASELEDQIVKEFTCSINFETLQKCKVPINPVPLDYNKLPAWISNIQTNINDVVEDLTDQLAKDKKSKPATLQDKKRVISTLRGISLKVSTLIETWKDSEYLIERESKSVAFIPLKVDKLAQRIFKYGDRVVLLSATIIDPANFCKVLGIEKFKYIEVSSTFKPENAPIYANTTVKLNYSNLKGNLPTIVKQIKQICEHHKLEKGIIHTQTNVITDYLKQNLNSDRVIYRELGVNNQDILDQHLSTDKPTIIASPSMSFGVDLKDDLARFQIIIKAPYLPTKDIRVERMMKVDSTWYINKMLCSLIQATGRGVRTPKDYCATYILDGAIIESIIRNKNKLPRYFIERFV